MPPPGMPPMPAQPAPGDNSSTGQPQGNTSPTVPVPGPSPDSSGAQQGGASPDSNPG
jgi:hypothetical protein